MNLFLSNGILRRANQRDLSQVESVYRSAFQRSTEADLVKELLQDPTAKPAASLLAEEGSQTVGHILFTKVTFEPDIALEAKILCPLAVVPGYQKKGVGKALIHEGIKLFKNEGVDIVFVLGWPLYYSKFGFKEALKQGFKPTYDIPKKNEPAWMCVWLHQNKTNDRQTRVICAEALNKKEYWVE